MGPDECEEPFGAPQCARRLAWRHTHPCTVARAPGTRSQKVSALPKEWKEGFHPNLTILIAPKLPFSLCEK
eukprot:scaffold167293_cov35-Tisochrysis_lutea.AAC.3